MKKRPTNPSPAALAESAWSGVASKDELAELEEYELTDDDDPGYRRKSPFVCICSDEQLARGGFTGGCKVHGLV